MRCLDVFTVVKPWVIFLRTSIMDKIKAKSVTSYTLRLVLFLGLFYFTYAAGGPRKLYKQTKLYDAIHQFIKKIDVT